MPTLIATKSLKYATRRLMPGDEFEASNRDAVLLVAIRKAKRKRAPGKVAAPSASVVARVTSTPDGTQTPIPEGWEDMHHTKIVALARELVGSDFEPSEGQTKTDKARAIIAATEANRANPPEKPGEA